MGLMVVKFVPFQDMQELVIKSLLLGFMSTIPSQNDEATAMLVAQVIWYFIEGVNCRIKDDDFSDST